MTPSETSHLRRLEALLNAWTDHPEGDPVARKHVRRLSTQIESVKHGRRASSLPSRFRGLEIVGITRETAEALDRAFPQYDLPPDELVNMLVQRAVARMDKDPAAL